MKIRIAFNGDRFKVEKRGFFCWEYVSGQDCVKTHDDNFKIGYNSLGEAIGFVRKEFGDRAAKGIQTKFFTVAEYEA